jgi:hypothetical protein
MHAAMIVFDVLGALLFVAFLVFACLPSAAVRKMAARLFGKKPRT